jgi:hypothetical protein
MTEIADKYISKSGRTAAYDRAAFTEDLLTASSFLYWAEEEYFGGHTGKDAFNAMCRMLDLDPIRLRKAFHP